MGCNNWFFESPPAPFVWVASVIAIIAFGGWLVDTIIKSICSPKLKMYLFGLNHTIWCEIQNVPIGRGYRIQRRPIQEFSVQLAIIDTNVHDEIFRQIHWDSTAHKLQFGDSEEKHSYIMLPASKLRARLEIARASEKKAGAFDENDELKIELHVGRYTAVITIYADGKQIEVSRDFKVNRDTPFIEWVDEGNFNL
jgi:hypothetical protein